MGTRIQKNHRQERKNKPYEITSRLNSIDDLSNNVVYNVPDGPSKSTKIVAKVPQILKLESEAKPFFNWEQDKFDDTTTKNRVKINSTYIRMGAISIRGYKCRRKSNVQVF